MAQVFYPPYHFSTSSLPSSRGLLFKPILCQPDKAQGRFTLQGAVYFGGGLSLQGSLGVVCQIDTPGIYEVTVPFLATGRIDIFALRVPLAVRQGVRLPLSFAASEVFLVGIVEDTNGRTVGSSPLSLVPQSSGGSTASFFPDTLLFSSSSYSLSIPNCLFQSRGLAYIYVDLQVRLRAAGMAFSRIDFASSGGNGIGVPFIKVAPTP